MDKFCSNCGNKLDENADVCLKCGRLLNNNSNKVPGKGLSIAGMILGIIAAFWVFISLLSVDQIEITLKYGMYYEGVAGIVGFAIGYTLFSFTPSILGLIFSTCGFKKKRSGFNVSGMILSLISLIISIIQICYILSFL